MRLLVRSLLLVLALGAGSALAQRQVRSFEEGRELSAEEIAAAKVRKSNLNAYGKDTSADVTPVPWMAISLGGLAVLIALPFALRSYKNTAKEIESRRA